MDFLKVGDKLVLTRLIAIEEKGGPNSSRLQNPQLDDQDRWTSIHCPAGRLTLSVLHYLGPVFHPLGPFQWWFLGPWFWRWGRSPLYHRYWPWGIPMAKPQRWELQD